MEKITISGLAGSGKSTVGRLLASRLSLPFISMGNMSRNFAKEKFGMNINEFQTYCANNPKIDKELDLEFEKIGKADSGFIMDYRLGPLFIPEGFHIYLKVDEFTAASRIKVSDRGDEFMDNSIETRLNNIRKRNASMVERFKSLYDFDFTHPGHYHLILDSAKLTPEECVEQVLHSFH
jgi:predicted cytidylate kinase